MSTATMTKNRANSLSDVRRLATLAMLAALAYIVMYVGRIPIWSFLKYDPKDVVIVIAGFIYGPLSACVISVVVSLIEMITVSDTGPIGMLMNVLSTCAFACTAAFIYERKRTKTGAVIGLLSGIAVVVPAMLLWNYIMTPLYMEMTREAVSAMLIPIFLPFNLLKGGINMGVTMLLYKPLITAMRHVNLLPERRSEDSGKFSIGFALLAVVILATAALVILANKGVF